MQNESKTPSGKLKNTCKRALSNAVPPLVCRMFQKEEKRSGLCGQPSLSPDCNGSAPFRPTAYVSAGQLWNGIHRILPLPFHQPEALFGKGYCSHVVPSAPLMSALYTACAGKSTPFCAAGVRAVRGKGCKGAWGKGLRALYFCCTCLELPETA